MAKKSVVPDPKSGRDSIPQNPNDVQTYIQSVLEMDEAGRTNEKQALKAETAFIRQAMNELQFAAGRERRLYGVVTEDVREALVSSRNAYRFNQRKIQAFNEVVADLSVDVEEE